MHGHRFRARSASGRGSSSDFCSVHSVWALRDVGCEAIIVNNNPETVSTDFDIADKLYFEPLTPEDVLHVVELEQPGRGGGAVRRADGDQAGRGHRSDGRADSWAPHF